MCVCVYVCRRCIRKPTGAVVTLKTKLTTESQVSSTPTHLLYTQKVLVRTTHLILNFRCNPDIIFKILKTAIQFYTVMTSSYISPGKGHGQPPAVNPVPKDYHHLESDRAFLSATKTRTSRSEASDQYGTPIEDPAECVAKRRETLSERTARISDNKQSHIHLGFDKPKQISEKVSRIL